MRWVLPLLATLMVVSSCTDNSGGSPTGTHTDIGATENSVPQVEPESETEIREADATQEEEQERKDISLWPSIDSFSSQGAYGPV